MVTRSMSDPLAEYTLFEKIRIVGIALLVLVVGAWGIRDLGPEVYRLLFTEPLVCTVADLVKQGNVVEVRVSGVINAERILVEQTNSRRTGENWFTHFYYPFFDKDRKTGFYVYSELAPINFLQQIGQGDVTLHGIWEEMPRDVRIQDPMTRQFEQMQYLQEHLKSKDTDSVIKALEAFHQQEPLIVWNRLNLHPARYKFSQAFMLIFSAAFFLLSFALLWMIGKAYVRKGSAKIAAED